jgi:transcriptional regulator with XRE-family HTH domain
MAHHGKVLTKLINANRDKFKIKDLSEFLGVTRMAIEHWRKSETIKNENLKKIAEFYQVDISYFEQDISESPKAEKNNEELDKYKDMLIETQQRYNDLLQKHISVLEDFLRRERTGAEDIRNFDFRLTQIEKLLKGVKKRKGDANTNGNEENKQLFSPIVLLQKAS